MVVKRKSSSKDKVLAKKVKADSKFDGLFSIEKIKELCDELDESAKFLNNIALLLQQYDLVLPQLSGAAGKELEDFIVLLRFLTVSILHVFEKLMVKEFFVISKGIDESKLKVAKWLRLKYQFFCYDILLEFFSLDIEEQDNDLLNSFKIDVLEIVMRLIKLESTYFAPNPNEPYFSLPLYKKLIIKLLTSGSHEGIQQNGVNDNYLVLEFYEQFFQKNWDLKFFFLSETCNILFKEEEEKEEKEEKKKVKDLQLIFSNFLVIMRNSIYKDYEIDSKQFFVTNPPSVIFKKNQFKINFEKTWLNFLNFPLTIQQYKQTLLILHKRIILFFNNPTKLMDFVTESYEIGFSNIIQRDEDDDEDHEDSIIISILALNGLYELMKNYNLEYPQFYEKLYKILSNKNLLHLNYKSRFFRMLDLFLSSTHLPAQLVASFIKKLSKLSLTSPPSGIVIVIPFLYNLLKKHPSCMIMLHNTNHDESYKDPFIDTEEDPLKTNAIGSSLWELQTLMSHYHPNVLSLAKIFGQPFNKYSYNLEDFLDWSYNNLLESELHKKFKGDISLEFEKFDKLLEKGKNDHEKSEISYMTGWQW
ncbi:hypothetical protein PACTADRAFT_49840 [Pachysolen tannophilus NRRL Y-2460]|uniref:CCAAT-binding factor domain-containing protein n=1 Tax=Pachysolen tannophilus NRRL Y-2460 TaxID=669874 RepID=A0A1E4TXW8_PACTA|nr:hypothetical protein PACTADRAFT_49840 [Pachysolen tannophilus NRRL Y-2460]